MLEALIDVVTEWVVTLLCLSSLLHVLVRLLFLLLCMSVWQHETNETVKVSDFLNSQLPISEHSNEERRTHYQGTGVCVVSHICAEEDKTLGIHQVLTKENLCYSSWYILYCSFLLSFLTTST
jgi:hypothetical protein